MSEANKVKKGGQEPPQLLIISND